MPFGSGDPAATPSPEDLVGARRIRGTRRRRRITRQLAEAGTPQAARTLVEVFLKATDERLTSISEQGLRDLTGQAAVDAVCDAALGSDDERLARLIAVAGHRHSDSARRAILLFLAGDFDAYAELDFDGSMLTAARAAGDSSLRARLATRARESGRVEWVRAIAAARPSPGAAAVSEPEWDAAIGILTAAGRWDELWRLVQHAPPVWGARILGELRRRGWRPPDGPDASGFDRLAKLAGACGDELTTGLFTTEPTRLTCSGSGSVSLAFTADGTALVAGKTDGFQGVWWIGHEPMLCYSSTGGSGVGGVNDVLAVPGTDLVAVAGTEGSKICRPATTPVTGLRTVAADRSSGAVDLAATPDGRYLLAAGHGALVWRPPWREPELLPRTEPLHRIAVSAVDGGCLAGVGRREPTVWLWKLSGGGPPAGLTGHKGTVNCLAVTPDGGLLASGGKDGTIRLWHLPTGEPAGVIEAERGGVIHLAVTPDGGLLASAGGEGAVRLWHLPSGEPAGELKAHRGWASHLAISPDGTLLASGGSDMTVRLWQLPSGEPAGVLTGHAGLGIITDLAFSPDGTRLATGANRATGVETAHVLLWRLWHPALSAATRTPVGDLGTDAQSLVEVVTEDRERAWAALVAALDRWRRRHDVELGDGMSTGPDHRAIELDR
jgi:WD40 repeat protein